MTTIDLLGFTLVTYIATIISAAVISGVYQVLVENTKEKTPLSKMIKHDEAQDKSMMITRMMYPVLVFFVTVMEIHILYGRNLSDVDYLKLLFFGTTGTMVFRCLITMFAYIWSARVRESQKKV